MAEYFFDPKLLSQRLMTIRIIWLALLLGQLAFLGVLIFIILPDKTRVFQPQPILFWVTLGMLVTVIPIGYVIRMFIFRSGRNDDGIGYAEFARGSIVFWATCESVSFLGLVGAMINGSLWPTIVFVAIAMGLQALTVPMRSSLSTQGDL